MPYKLSQMNEKEIKIIIKAVTIVMLHKESQVSRSIISSCNRNKEKFKKLNEKYKKESYELLKELMDKADDSSIKNEDIRGSIKKLSKNAGVSVGQAQKLINVVLKYYCLISGKGFNGVKRTTFIIKDGKIVKVFENVNPNGHEKEILEFLK